MAEFNAFNNCSSDKDVTGLKCIPDIGAPEKPFLTTVEFEFATIEDANDIAKHNEGIEAQEIFPLPFIDELSDNSEDDERYTSQITKLQRKISKGKTIHQYMFPFDPSLHSRLQSFDGATMRYYYADTNANLTGTSPDGTKFIGFEVRVDIGKWTVSDGGGTPSHTPVTITYMSNLEREKQISIFPSDFNVKGLEGIYPASIEVIGTPTATELIVDVKCGNTAVTGLTEVTQFLYLQADGVTQETITVVAESATIAGRYTLSAAAMATLGTINLGTPSNPVVTIGTSYYKASAVTVTI